MATTPRFALVVFLGSLVLGQAAGRQLTGPHAPASSQPLTPEEAQNRFRVPAGFQVRLFAAEPQVVNPVAMTWDDRGRLWVLELFEYPKGAAEGTKPRDRIRILEDTDNDGRADTVTLFADGLNLATGILYGDGGVYVGQAPHLLFLKDTDGDDVADERSVLLTGFGLEDRHELLNGFAWGPDGWLYMTQGVFTHSKVRRPGTPENEGVILNAAVARFHPKTLAFEIFADGTSNPWGVDFDRYGNAFVSACVIDHLFHMAPGGHYVRQAGQPEHRYGYELIPSIVDHKHYRAAYGGVQVYQGNQYPAEYQGRIFMGNIHGNAVNQDRLTPDGSSFKASALENFVRTDDGWFRPLSQQVGPDGALWVMDWYDKYPCYQNAQADPEGVDREHGRIWRVLYTADQPDRPMPTHPPGIDLGRERIARLVQALAHPNVWHRRQAQRLLAERRDPNARIMLLSLLQNGPTLDSRLASLWTLHASGQLDESLLDELATDAEFAIRMWTARFTGERRTPSEAAVTRLRTLAADSSAPVRLAVATAARQYVSGSLTVNSPVDDALANLAVEEVITALIQSSASERDSVIPFLIWLGLERLIERDPARVLVWFIRSGPDTLPLSATLTRKSIHRLCDTGDAAKIDIAVNFIELAAQKNAQLAAAALDGMLEGQRATVLKPATGTDQLFSTLLRNPEPAVVERAQRLGALWGDPASLRVIRDSILDPNASDASRLKVIELAGQLQTDGTREAMLQLVGTESRANLLIAAIHSLNRTGADQFPETVLGRWSQLPPPARRAAIDALISRPVWLDSLLTALEQGPVAPGELPVTVVRNLTRHKDDAIRARAAKAIGRFREPDANIEQLIAAKKLVVLEGEPDLAAGRRITETACLVCHKLHGKGAEVGPDLTGVGRSTLDALLAHVINPNQIIGAGYENVQIETRDERSLSGRVIEQTDAHVKLLSAGPKEEIVSRANIDSMTTSEVSVMPEGLEQIPDADFRNLIWFILNPPEDNRPMTPELRLELVGDPPRISTVDWESVALWNPDWRVRSEELEDAPAKLPRFANRQNVLVTHPFRHQSGATLQHTLRVPDGKSTRLNFNVAAREKGNWVLRVFVQSRLIHKEPIDSPEWKPVSIDLSEFAGKEVQIQLENFAYDMQNDYGYWHDLRIISN